MSIQLIVGLGNIGQEYAQTRHNAGWWMLDELAATWGASFREDKKYYAEVAKANTPQGEVWLMKPSTYMNKSGQAVGALANFFKIPVSDLLVLHDELDIPEHALRLKRGGGEGGHNGLRSISAALGTKDYVRVRVGVGRPPGRQDPADYVLSDFPSAQREDLGVTLENAADAVQDVVTLGLTAAQNRWNQSA